MPGSDGMHSYGAKLYFAPFGTANPNGADPAGAGFTEVAEVISDNGLPNTSPVTRLTHLNSADRAQEKIPGILDPGQYSGKANFTLAGMNALVDILPDAAVTSPEWGRLQWVKQFPSGSQWYFTGFLQQLPTDTPEDDRVTLDFTIEVSGRPAFLA